MDDYRYFWIDWKDFRGETDKATFWWTTFMHIGVFFILVPLLFVFPDYVYKYIVWGYIAIAFIPQLAMIFRRLNDGHVSYWHLLWNLIPVFGQFIFLGILLIEVDYAGDARVSNQERRQLRGKQEDARVMMDITKW
ncbi:MAG: DUF805 domain-containing protein [Candidatus Izemoplasma sp.]